MFRWNRMPLRSGYPAGSNSARARGQIVGYRCERRHRMPNAAAAARCRRPRQVAQQIVNDRLPVDGISERLSNPHVPQDWVAQVKCQVRVDGAGGCLHRQLGIALQGEHGVAGERIERNIGAALAEFQRARGASGTTISARG